MNSFSVLGQEAFLARTTWRIVAVLLVLGLGHISKYVSTRTRTIAVVFLIHLPLLFGTSFLVLHGLTYADEVRILGF